MLRLLGGSSEVHMRSLRLCLFLGQLPSFRELLSWAVDSVLKSKKQRLHFADEGSDSQSYGISSSHVQM